MDLEKFRVCRCWFRRVRWSWKPDSRSLVACALDLAKLPCVDLSVDETYLRYLAHELDRPEGLRIAARDIIGHLVSDRAPVVAVLRSVQLQCTGTVVNPITGIDERVDSAAGNADVGAASGSSRVCGELLVVEEGRDGVVSAVALSAREGVEVEDTAIATVGDEGVRKATCNTAVDCQHTLRRSGGLGGRRSGWLK